MSNNTFNFNAPVHIHMENEADIATLQDIMEKLYDLEDLMCALIDTLYGDTDYQDDEEDSEDAEETGEKETCRPAEEVIPMILCFTDDLPEDFAPEEAAAIAEEALSHILNFKSRKEDHHGRA